MGTLKDQLYYILAKSIKCGRLETGLVLIESNLAEIFCMSRSPVRKTLERLHTEEKISRFDGRGYLVGKQPQEVIRRPLTDKDFYSDSGQAAVKRTDTWLSLAENVERDIVLCSMIGRMELNELQMAKSLGVSRTITQRILLYLQSLGVVEKTKYSSWNVVPLDDIRLHHLYEARRQLEPFMIARASERLPKRSIRAFIDRLDRAQELYPNIQGGVLDELEIDLHQKALVAGDNTEIITMLQRTRPILLVSKHLLGGEIELPQDDPFFDEHRKIFLAMLSRSTSHASQALAAHLATSEAKVKHRLVKFRSKADITPPSYLRKLDPV